MSLKHEVIDVLRPSRRLTKRLKYRNVPVVVDGIRFASQAEARRYQELRLLERGGDVRKLELQKRFPLYVEDRFHDLHHVGDYVCDFAYEERMVGTLDWRVVVEDVKGVKTPVYQLKKKLLSALYGVTIRETGGR